MNGETEVFDTYGKCLSVTRDEPSGGVHVGGFIDGWLFDDAGREQLIAALIATRPAADVTVADQREDLEQVALHASEYAPGEGLRRQIRSAIMSAADAYAQAAAWIPTNARQ